MEKINLRQAIHPLEQTPDQRIVTTNRNTLVTVVKIIIVEDPTHRQTPDDKSRKILTVPSPLLLRIFLDQYVEDILSHKRQRLLLQILRFPSLQSSYSLCPLLRNLDLRLLRRSHPPHLIERIHIKRQIEQTPLIIRDRTIGITIKFYQTIDKVPYLLAISMKDMRPVLMNRNTLYHITITIDIPAQMRTLLNHQAFFPSLTGSISKSGTKESGTHYQIIIFSHFCSNLKNLCPREIRQD
ncbi:hypothetical protein EVA_02285 [gut metagenome]|uniref:Uncharacterized protein n=1 Tax=gut metagenome TaxID=749906 RepID=J9H1J3_9ZZZZ